MIKAYYRYSDRENKAIRPRWFSRELCLKSFIRSYLKAQQILGIKMSFVFCVDTPGVRAGKLTPKIEEMIRSVGGRVKLLGGLGNAGAYRAVLTMARSDSDGTFQIFAEDDYLWTVDAVSKLYLASRTIDADYFTPYDHPVRYDVHFVGGADVPHWNTTMFRSSDGTHFRPHESTCMTFGAYAKTMNNDLKFHRLFTAALSKAPQDRELFRCLQKLGAYTRRPGPRHLLIGPMPSLATHCHEPYLPAGIDWGCLARETKRWNIPH